MFEIEERVCYISLYVINFVIYIFDRIFHGCVERSHESVLFRLFSLLVPISRPCCETAFLSSESRILVSGHYDTRNSTNTSSPLLHARESRDAFRSFMVFEP